MNKDVELVINRIKNHIKKMKADREIKCVCMAGYEFAHIVLDDWNFDDRHIQFCLKETNEWFQEKLEELDPEYNNPDAKERWKYDAICKFRQETEDLLNWLLSIPQDIRDEAEDYMWSTDLAVSKIMMARG